MDGIVVDLQVGGPFAINGIVPRIAPVDGVSAENGAGVVECLK